MGVLLHRAKPERVLWTTQGAQVRTRRSDEISGCGRGIKGAGLQFLFALRATHTKRSFSKRKRFVSFLKRQSVPKHSAVPLSVAVPLRDTAAHCPLSRAGALSGTTRPRLLASSFSRRLQGDFRPEFPSASHRHGGSLCGNRGVTRPYPRQMFHFTGLSYHIFPVCQGGIGKKLS